MRIYIFTWHMTGRIIICHLRLCLQAVCDSVVDLSAETQMVKINIAVPENSCILPLPKERGICSHYGGQRNLRLLGLVSFYILSRM